MIRTLLVTGLCAVTLVGCGKTVVRETVVERPAAAVAVAPPAVAVATAPANCSLAGTSFGTGSLTCQAGIQHRCNNGAWEAIRGSYC